MAWCTLPLLLGALALQARAGDFDWRTRGVLFRVEPPLAAIQQDIGRGGDPTRPAGADPAGQAPPSGDGDAGDAVPSGQGDAYAPASPRHSYVFATIHYGDPDTLLLYLPRLRQRLSESRVLVNEVDLEEVWQPEYETYRKLATGQSLRRLIGDQAFAELQAQLPDTPPQALDTLKPWVAMSMLEFPFGAETRSIDAMLQDWAGQAGMARVHLENLPDQLAALDCVPPTDYAKVLEQRLLSGWSFDLDAERTAGYYRERDLAAWLDDVDSMHGLTGAALAAEEEARRCLISVRNERWLPVLDGLLRQGGHFVAVGAIHLTGDEGLLAQLSRRGFEIDVEPW
ncbi:hypothetical protein WQ53_03170 [Pseudoxanthomonas suwonensis]|uniref:TraB/GumN family protein n=2 Tax=Pseudoxanthomonas suwonensis TaxID=314722 RepID=A0A0E3Z1Y5_9GAMM|nr:hypothetical protein WQ53_03170 [Pseudoxanthomonas suwonensis]